MSNEFECASCNKRYCKIKIVSFVVMTIPTKCLYNEKDFIRFKLNKTH